jgi:uncharacterized protein YecE (DUF72 family)
VERVLVGCCGFPIARARYQAEFPVVEVQQTFYQLPRPGTARRWREEAPSGFRFAMKAWQLITHPPSSPTYRRLREPLPGPPDAFGWFRPTPEVREAWRRTLEVARELGAEVVVLQCPASFTPTDPHVADLRAFCSAAPRDGVVLAWEPRGAWPLRLVEELCRELDLVHCVDPFVAREVPGPLAYYRLHGRGGYRYRYTDDDLAELRRRCLAALGAGAREVWAMFNNVAMLEDARRFRALLAAGPGDLVAGGGGRS